MTTEIAIVGGLFFLFSFLGAIFWQVDSAVSATIRDRNRGIQELLGLIGWLLVVALYVLALVK